MDTAQMVYNMITENTGRHMLDSGDFYGRAWERNQKHTLEDFKSSPEFVMEAQIYGDRLELDVTKSLFHHLTNNLHYDEYIDRLFHRFVDVYIRAWYEYWDEEDNKGYGDFSWEKAMNAFAELIAKDRKGNRQYNSWEFDGGEDFHGYTYNDENILSQDFVYNQVGSYVFIQTHNGCDARGGFSWPHLFQISGNNEYGFIEYSRYTVGCKNGHWWDFDGGYENTEQPMTLFKDHYSKLPVAQFIDGDDEELVTEINKQVIAWKKEQDELKDQYSFEYGPEYHPMPSLFSYGTIVVKDGTATCPCCGEPLEVWGY